jgi:diguanylate cyclase (GGDEF)-like protein
MSLLGIGASLIGIWATISSSWLPANIPNERWATLVLGVTLVALAVGALCSELPRLNALLSEQRRLNEQEVVLRAQLQSSYDEQQILLAEVERLYQEQARAALTDAITGLPNHRAVMKRIDEEISRCQRTKGSCAVLFIDLDHFKQINDTWGHQAGDTILHEVSQRLFVTLRLHDFDGRYGGEEFAIVLAESDLFGASQVAERLRDVVASLPCSWKAEETKDAVNIPVTTSIGVAVYAIHGSTREELLQQADNAMYRAKHSGRNCVRLADGQMDGNLVTSTIELPPTVSERDITTVQALAATAQIHDRGTDAHARRMVLHAEAIARALNHSEEEIHLIRLAALLHDIGKIGIPDAILHKAGPLTEVEWNVMRHHPEMSRQILMQAGGVFERLGHIVVAHHERWDGTGYPYGLAKEAIPMSARILSVLDAYDAMTSQRVYREPLSSLAARAELRNCSGSQFDPSVVEALMNILEEEDRVSQDLALNLSSLDNNTSGKELAHT